MTLKASPPDMHEGPSAAERFDSLMGRVLSVSKDELKKREAAHARRKGKTAPAKKRRR